MQGGRTPWPGTGLPAAEAEPGEGTVLASCLCSPQSGSGATAAIRGTELEVQCVVVWQMTSSQKDVRSADKHKALACWNSLVKETPERSVAHGLGAALTRAAQP